MTSAVQKASQALNERGERLGRAEERTADMMNSAEQFSVTAQKVRQYMFPSIPYSLSPKIKHLTETNPIFAGVS